MAWTFFEPAEYTIVDKIVFSAGLDLDNLLIAIDSL